ncbi:uncharacterized protein LOC108745011 [Agrilus planipennis]|uniref:Uncharacterized protein LOC108745011 n=1 Tax=Agrilus planipennis TaxID=224129 RepID=A0A1W4XVM0_AGRPL|nr:uncharacterized protein LOC108745011 [Agrilus planipennis]
MASSVKGVGLFKRAWHEIPEIVGSSFMGLIGIGCAIAGVYNYNKRHGNVRKYKTRYTVIRSDDPDIEIIKAKKEGRL